MILNSKAVKRRGKEVLSGKLGRGMFACGIPLFIGVALSLVIGLLAFATPVIVWVPMIFVLYIFLFHPLALGTIRYMYRLAMSEVNDDPIGVFHYFSNGNLYKRALAFQINLFFKKFAVAVLLSIPLFALWIITNPLIYEYFDFFMPVWAQSLSYLTRYFVIAAVFFYILITLRYYLAAFLFVADEDMHVAEAVYMSKCISKRTVIDFLALIFSHWWQLLLCVFLAPMLFLLPFIAVDFVIHCDSAVKQYNDTIDAILKEQNRCFAEGI